MHDLGRADGYTYNTHPPLCTHPHPRFLLGTYMNRILTLPRHLVRSGQVIFAVMHVTPRHPKVSPPEICALRPRYGTVQVAQRSTVQCSGSGRREKYAENKMGNRIQRQ